MKFVYTKPSDPAARPLFRELEHEYSTRYGRVTVLSSYPNHEFEEAHGGAFLLLYDGDEPVAGGAFRRYDEHTAELKRIWTSSGHRRRGLGLLVVEELEQEAARRGYTRIYLTTGPRQPEARGLYLRAGYRPLFDVDADPATLTEPLPFEKPLADSQVL
ncbi:GNAT family N-acetyltransferase [Kutzneria sp. NPDC052558]|uniref:GNAT family N-acetyltransferase n=1 Tax=Kutzneria sp. NPDC052558 TaxID=3364121 RepID=UPI0037C7A541